MGNTNLIAQRHVNGLSSEVEKKKWNQTIETVVGERQVIVSLLQELQVCGRLVASLRTQQTGYFTVEIAKDRIAKGGTEARCSKSVHNVCG